MRWYDTPIDVVTDTMRFLIRGAMLVCGIALSATLVYLLIKFCWFAAKYIDRTIYARPW